MLLAIEHQFNKKGWSSNDVDYPEVAPRMGPDASSSSRSVEYDHDPVFEEDEPVSYHEPAADACRSQVPRKYRKGRISIALGVRLDPLVDDGGARKVLNALWNLVNLILITIIDILGPSPFKPKPRIREVLRSSLQVEGDNRDPEQITVELKGKRIDGGVPVDGNLVTVNGERGARGVIKTDALYVLESEAEIVAR